MSTEYKQVKQLAKESLMADFFAVRIEEEGLWPKLQELLTRIQMPSPHLPAVKTMAKESTSANEFIDKVKEANKWDWLRNMLVRLNLK